MDGPELFTSFLQIAYQGKTQSGHHALELQGEEKKYSILNSSTGILILFGEKFLVQQVIFLQM